MWAYNYFQTKIDNLTAEMTYTSKEMIDYLIKGVSGEFGRSRFTREFSTTARRFQTPIPELDHPPLTGRTDMEMPAGAADRSRPNRTSRP